MKNRAIANIENTIGRRATLIAVTPLVAVAVLLVGSLVLLYTGAKVVWREWGYVFSANATVVVRGYRLAWLGKDEYYKRADKVAAEKILRMFSRKA